MSFFLPKCAPELNPAELLWASVKGHGLNKVFVRNRSEFRAEVDMQLQKLSREKKLCLSFFGKKQVAYIGEARSKKAA